VILLAVKMLVGDRTKWLGVVLGAFLCTFLITHMLSMFTGMMRRAYALVTDIPQADIWVMDPAVQYVDEPIAMSDNALLEVRGVNGVDWATPLFTGTLPVRLPNGGFQGALVVGVDDATLIGLPKGLVDCKPDDLRRADGGFVDVIGAQTTLAMPVGSEPWPHGRVKVQYEGPTRPLHKGDELMVNDHRVLVTGKVDLGPRFLAKPILYTTYSRAVFMSPRQRSLLSFVLVKAEKGLDPVTLARRIESRTGLRARTGAEFADDTFWYYMLKTGVVSRIVFMISTAVVVGLSVSSLLFYLFTNENAPYYALLKAMGTTDGVLTRMIVVQAIVGTMCGLGLGLGASCALGQSLSGNSMPYAMVWQVILASSGAIILVTIVASIISVRRIVRLEPAMVFK
jgi:putative ABC transport system permease protein